MRFVRAGESVIPYVDEAKRYGNYGENEFTAMLCRELPGCKIKRNVMISVPEGNAEIDCLVLYQNKLFAIEVKSWKGCLTEQENGFLQEKTDRWTGEIHAKYLKSPFKQVSRAIFLLRKQIPFRAWINPVVFFEGDELESVTAFADHVWFVHDQDLVDYIRSDGRPSFGEEASRFFDCCVPADLLRDDTRGRSLYCVVDRTALQLDTPQGVLSADRIAAIRILHHWSYDEVCVQTADGPEHVLALENAKIQVTENGRVCNYALCKLDHIVLGRTIHP